MKFDEEISFIAKHYRKGLFNPEKALKKIRPSKRWWSASKIVAASFLFIILGATAALFIRQNYFFDKTEFIETNTEEITAPEFVVRAIDFDDTPLPVVVDEINLVYGVEIINLPTDADQYHLSLHYEGSAIDLIETINEILGTHMEIRK